MEVARVVAYLGFKEDTTELVQYEKHVKAARTETKKPIEQPIGWDEKDAHVFSAYQKKLKETQATVARKERFRAKLGADFDPRAFTAAEREIKRVDRANRNLSDSSDGLVRAQGRIRTAFGSIYSRGGSMIAATGVVYGLTRAIGSTIQAGTNFQDSLLALKGVANLTNRQLKAVSDSAIKLGNDVTLPGTSASDAAQAMTEMIKAGVSLKDTMTGVRSVLVLSAAAGIDNAKAAEIASNALNAFKLKGKDVAFVTDALANAANASSIEITDASDAFKMAAAVYAGFQAPVVGAKGSITELTTAIALLGNAGIKGSDAGTSLKQALLQLTGPSNKSKDAMKALYIAAKDAGASQKLLAGISRDGATERGKELDQLIKHNKALGGSADIAYDATGKMRSLNEVVQLVTKGTSKMTQEEKNSYLTQIFGADATRSIIALMKAGPAAYDKMTEAVTRQGEAQRIAKTRNEGVRGAFDALKSSANTLQIQFFELVKAPLRSFLLGVAGAVGQIIPTLQTVNRLYHEHRDRVTALFVAVAALTSGFVAYRSTVLLAAAAQALFTGGGTVLAFLKLVGSVRSLKDAWIVLNLVMTANPIGLVVAAVAALSAGLYVLYTRSATARKIMDGTWKALRTAAETVFPVVKKLMEIGLIGPIGIIITNLHSLEKVVKSVFGSMKHVVSDFVDFWLGAVSSVLGGISSMLTAAGHLPGVGGKFKDAAKAIDKVRDAIDNMRGKLHDANKPINTVKGNIKGLGDVASSTAGAVISDLNAALGAMGAKKLSIHVGHSGAHGAASDLGAPDIGGFSTHAGGGIPHPGSGSRDDHILIDPRGRPVAAMSGTEGILNTPQMGVVDYALGGMAAMGLLPPGMGGLNQLWGSGMKHYAGGGAFPGVSGDTDFLPALGRALSSMARSIGQTIFVQSGRRTLGEQASLVASKGLYNAATNPHGAAAPSPNAPHVRGVAADITPGREVFGSAASRFGLGFTVPTEPWHIQLAGSGGGGGGGGGVSISPPTVSGTSPIGVTMGRQAGKLLAKAANAYIGKHAPSFTGGETGVTGGGGGGNRALGHTMMRAFGFGENQWSSLNSLWTKESGWDAGARNPSSGAAGIVQDITGNMHGGARGQIAWGLNYIKGRYGTPAAAWAHEQAYNWYRGGGLLRRFKGGGALQRSRAAATRASAQHSAAVGQAKDPYHLGVLSHPVKTGVKEYDSLKASLADQQTHYGQVDRAYGQSDEVFINPDTGALDMGAIHHRVRELDKLLALRQRIVDTIEHMRAVMSRIIASLHYAIARTQAALAAARKKDRPALKKQLAGFKASLPDHISELHQLGFDVIDARLDVGDIRKEKTGVLGTQPELKDTTPTDDGSGGGSTDTSTGGGITADQQAQINQAAALKAIVERGTFLDTTSAGILGGTINPQAAGGVQWNNLNPGAIGQAVTPALAAKAAAMGVDLNAPVGGTAGGSAGGNVQVVFNTAFPPSPQQAEEAARGVVAGLSYQGSVNSPRTSLGV